MTVCAMQLQDKQRLARRVGRDLKRRHGAKPSYSPEEIRGSMRRLDYPYMWDCWALSLYTPVDVFDAFHRARGESCDYQTMHAEMSACLAGAAGGTPWSLWDWFDFSWPDWISSGWSWPDWHLPSWLDFDFFDYRD